MKISVLVLSLFVLSVAFSQEVTVSNEVSIANGMIVTPEGKIMPVTSEQARAYSVWQNGDQSTSWMDAIENPNMYNNASRQQGENQRQYGLRRVQIFHGLKGPIGVPGPKGLPIPPPIATNSRAVQLQSKPLAVEIKPNANSIPTSQHTQPNENYNVEQSIERDTFLLICVLILAAFQVYHKLKYHRS